MKTILLICILTLFSCAQERPAIPTAPALPEPAAVVESAVISSRLFLLDTVVPRIKLYDGESAWSIMEAGGFGSFSGYAIAGLQIGTTGYGECVLYDDAGYLKVQLEAEGGGRLKIAGLQVVGERQPHIEPSDGTAEDNARAINQLIAELETHGLLESGAGSLAVKQKAVE